MYVCHVLQSKKPVIELFVLEERCLPFAARVRDPTVVGGMSLDVHAKL